VRFISTFLLSVLFSRNREAGPCCHGPASFFWCSDRVFDAFGTLADGDWPLRYTYSWSLSQLNAQDSALRMPLIFLKSFLTTTKLSLVGAANVSCAGRSGLAQTRLLLTQHCLAGVAFVALRCSSRRQTGRWEMVVSKVKTKGHNFCPPAFRRHRETEFFRLRKNGLPKKVTALQVFRLASLSSPYLMLHGFVDPIGDALRIDLLAIKL